MDGWRTSGRVTGLRQNPARTVNLGPGDGVYSCINAKPRYPGRANLPSGGCELGPPQELNFFRDFLPDLSTNQHATHDELSRECHGGVTPGAADAAEMRSLLIGDRLTVGCLPLKQAMEVQVLLPEFWGFCTRSKETEVVCRTAAGAARDSGVKACWPVTRPNHKSCRRGWRPTGSHKAGHLGSIPGPAIVS